jgi:SAM-dependent methyltransferase
MSHVLEHVSDPESFVSGVAKSLRPEGVLFIEVPCRDHEHKELHEPHLLFFDKNPLYTLLGKMGFLNIELSYHGRSLDRLSKPSFLNNIWNAVRMRLIKGGIVWPFSGRPPGLRHMDDPLVRAVVAPHLAHIESDKPAWWLRGLAVKGS